MKTMAVSRVRRPGAESAVSAPPLTVSRRELLVDDSDSTFRSFIHNLLTMAARIETIRNRFGQVIGLTGIQYSVLISIAHLQTTGNVSVRLVAQHLHLSGAFVTTETNKLVRMSLLEKSPDENDRRKVRLRVTATATRLLRTLAPLQRQANDVLVEALGSEQFRSLCYSVPYIVKGGDRVLRLLDYMKQDDV
jgi:DNA-binding MarR family transcriptional regulator